MFVHPKTFWQQCQPTDTWAQAQGELATRTEPESDFMSLAHIHRANDVTPVIAILIMLLH